MKPKWNYLLAFISTSIVFYACDSVSKRDTTKSQADRINEVKFENPIKEDDALFVVDIYAKGIMAIEMSKLADSITKTQEIKALAKTINDDHVKLNSQLADLAVQKHITLPDSLNRDMRMRQIDLAELRGKPFDNKYLEFAIQNQKGTITYFENKINDATTNPELKKILTVELPGLKLHYQDAIKLKEHLFKGSL